MNIQNVGQLFTINRTETAKIATFESNSEPSPVQKNQISSIGNTSSYQYNIDMHNISPNEYNQLTRSGVTDLADPIIFPNGQVRLDGMQAEMGDVKTDYISQINQQIDYAKSIGDENTIQHLSERLSLVNDLHGKTVELKNNFLKNITA